MGLVGVQSGMRGLATLACMFATAGPASAEQMSFGAEVGYRATDLTGHIRPDWGHGAGGTGLAELHFDRTWSIGLGAGLRASGSAEYRLIYFAAPLLAHGRIQLRDGWRLRASAGIAVASLLSARNVNDGYDGGTTSSDVSSFVEQWDTTALIAGAVEWRFPSGSWMFVEARAGQGLRSVDRGDLYIVNREVGGWVGMMFE